MSAARSAAVVVCLAFARVATAAAPIEITCVGPRDACESLMSALVPIVGADGGSKIADAAPGDVEAARGNRIVIDVATTGKVQIFVSDGERRTLVRVIDGDGASSVVSETVVQIVRETANALHVQEPEVEVLPPTSPPRLIPVAPTVVVEPEEAGSDDLPLEPARPRLELSLNYAQRATIPWGVLYRDAPSEQGVIGSLVFGIPRPHDPFLEIMGGWTGLSLGPTADNLGTPALTIDRFSARALLGLAFPLPPVEIRGALGFGADALWARSGDTGQGTVLLPTLEGIVQGMVELPLAGLVAQGTVTLDVQPKTKFTEGVGYPAGFDFAWTRRVQPGFMAGLGWRR